MNPKKCIFCAMFGILLDHIVCNQALLVDLVKIALILSLPPPTNVKMLRVSLGHTGYYHKFIRGYAAITAPMEKLMKKYAIFVWIPKFQGSFDTFVPILVFPD